MNFSGSRNSLELTTVPSVVWRLVEGSSEELVLAIFCWYVACFLLFMILHRVYVYKVNTVLVKTAKEHPTIIY